MLGKSGDALNQETTRLIAEFCGAKDEGTRIEIIRAIAEGRTPRAVETLGAFVDAERIYALAALEGLVRLPGAHSEVGLIRFLESREPDVVVGACRALASLGGAASREPLRRLLQGLRTPWAVSHAAQEALRVVRAQRGGPTKAKSRSPRPTPKAQ